MKGIFDKSAFLRNTINIERCLQSELPSKKVCSQNCHSYFFHTMINFRFSLSSHHCKLRRQRLYRQTSSAFGDFALKHSLHLKAINHAIITTRWVTVLLFIIFNEKCRKFVLKIHCFQINKEMIRIASLY